MEVHKHPHRVAHAKKWGEYLLEFLMLFLAVFLWLLAENKREQLAEKKKAAEYASSLYEYLRIDGSRLFDLSCSPEIGKSPYSDIHFPEPGDLLTYDENVLAEYFNNVLFAKRIFNVQRIRLGLLRDQNNRLQQLLKKEYHLE